MFVVAAFYKFVTLDSCAAHQAKLTELAQKHEIFGTILLANEGINGTVCGTRAAIDALGAYFNSHKEFNKLVYKESFSNRNPFLRRHIKVKPEIVTLGQPCANPLQKAGVHVTAHQWNALLDDPSVVVIDVRNRYETALGMFKGAIDPQTSTFKEFPDFVRRHLNPKTHKRIAMSCTGGIRCEKASAFLLTSGFEHVYQLDGGVLQYLEDMPKDHSKWQGECFVFDHRVAVDHNLKPGLYSMCFGCRMPLSAQDKLSPDYVPEVKCPHCSNEMSEQRQTKKRIRAQQMAHAERLGKAHLGHNAMLQPKRA